MASLVARSRSSFCRGLSARSFSSSTLSHLYAAAAAVKEEVLAAAAFQPLQPGPRGAPELGDWSEVRGQASTVSSWPVHPLEPKDRLALAHVLVQQTNQHLGLETSRGDALCTFFNSLLTEADDDQIDLLAASSEGTAKCAVVALSSVQNLEAAVSEAVSLLMSGYAVTIAAPAEELPVLDEVLKPFPTTLPLLQSASLGPLQSLPAVVSSLRIIGEQPEELWTAVQPPRDLGGLSRASPSGLCCPALPLALARTKVSSLAAAPRSRYQLSLEAADLLSLLSTSSTKDVPSAPGLPPPRWARSAYDRGVEEIHDLLDLLWAFRDPSSRGTRWALAPAQKHFLLTSGGTEVPEEIVKAAVLTASSPFKEPVTLHILGLSARSLSLDPLKSFCRLVQSGSSNLEWRLLHHESWADFMKWVDGPGRQEGPISLFGSLRGMEDALKQSIARAGGVSWDRLFTQDPFQQLRRCTQPAIVPDGVEPAWLRPGFVPEVEVMLPLSPAES